MPTLRNFRTFLNGFCVVCSGSSSSGLSYGYIVDVQSRTSHVAEDERERAAVKAVLPIYDDLRYHGIGLSSKSYPDTSLEIGVEEDVFVIVDIFNALHVSAIKAGGDDIWREPDLEKDRIYIERALLFCGALLCNGLAEAERLDKLLTSK